MVRKDRTDLTTPRPKLRSDAPCKRCASALAESIIGVGLSAWSCVIHASRAESAADRIPLARGMSEWLADAMGEYFQAFRAGYGDLAPNRLLMFNLAARTPSRSSMKLLNMINGIKYL